MRRVAEAARRPVGIALLPLCGFGADGSGLHYMVGAFPAMAVGGTMLTTSMVTPRLTRRATRRGGRFQALLHKPA